MNADFTTGTFSNWSTLGSGVFADVLKQPWNAFNREKTVLSMGCGASCASGASIYQDVTGVSDLAGVNMTASVALASNISGVVQLQVFQFTSSGALIGSSIGSSSLALRGSGQWQTFKKYFKAAPNVEKMRFQIYLETPNAQILLNEPNLGASDGSHPEPYVAR